MMQHCLFCSGDASEPDHLLKCDGRQGRAEAATEFNLDAARADRDDAIARVDAHASDAFNEAAFLALVAVARREARFIVDAVWQELGCADSPTTTHEKRAMGAVMLRGIRERYIVATEEFQPSAQRQCHANPRRVWRSLVRSLAT